MTKRVTVLHQGSGAPTVVPFRAVRLVPTAPPSVCTDTISCLEQLLERARSGDVIGLAFGAVLRNRQYIVDSTGEAQRNPTYGLGVVRMLDAELTRRILNANE